VGSLNGSGMAVIAALASAFLRFCLRRYVQSSDRASRIKSAPPPAAPPAMAAVLFFGEGVEEIVDEAAGGIERMVVVGVDDATEDESSEFIGTSEEAAGPRLVGVLEGFAAAVKKKLVDDAAEAVDVVAADEACV